MKSVMITIIILLLAPLAHFSDTYANDYFDSPYAKKIEANYKFVTDKNLSKVDLYPFFSSYLINERISGRKYQFIDVVGVHHNKDEESAVVFVTYKFGNKELFKSITLLRIESGHWVVYSPAPDYDAFAILFTSK